MDEDIFDDDLENIIDIYWHESAIFYLLIKKGQLSPLYYLVLCKAFFSLKSSMKRKDVS